MRLIDLDSWAVKEEVGSSLDQANEWWSLELVSAGESSGQLSDRAAAAVSYVAGGAVGVDADRLDAGDTDVGVAAVVVQGTWLAVVTG